VIGHRSTWIRILPVALALTLAVTLLSSPVAAPGAQENPPGAVPRGDQAPGVVRLYVQPTRVDINLFYGGATIQVRAHVPASMALALVLEGRRAPLTVKRKGRVWGMLWMNVGDVEFDEVPTTYLLATSARLPDLAPRVELERLGLGYEALALAARGNAGDFRELIKLKEKDGLFSVAEGSLRLEPGNGTYSRLSASLRLSAKAPAGQYEIRLFGFQGGEGRCLDSTGLVLEPVGFVRDLHVLATERGLLYGCVAVVVALIAGLATGLVFGRGAGKGH